MAESRDDFIIAIRSAFLKKSTQQKFSLLTLVFFSVVIIILSNFNFKAINVTKSIIKEIVYRSSFIVSIPENLIKSSYYNVNEYTNYYKEYKQRKFINVIASTGLTAAAGTLFFLTTFSLGGDFYFGP